MSTAQPGLLEGWSSFALRPLGGVIAFLFGGGLVLSFGDTAVQTVIAPLCDALHAMGREGCTLVFASPRESFALILRQALLAGAILATPFLVFQAARFLAPNLWRHDPKAILPFSVAGGVLALLGATYAIFVEAPRAFAPVLTFFEDRAATGALLNFEADYARAALVMAAGYAAVLQLPVLALMMIKSRRTGRAIHAEGRA